jgi:hypothetical protein
MRQGTLSFAGMMVAVMVLMGASATGARAQGVSLQEQLNAQYKLTKMGSDTSGTSVVDAGTLLSVSKGGILAVPYTDQNIMTTHYENGQVKSPNSTVMKGIGFGMKKYMNKDQTTHLIPSGDKVYFTGISVNPAKDQVSVNIVECDTCNKTDPPTYMKATVVFQFAKGALATMQAGPVEDTIGQLFAMSDDNGSGGGDQNAQQGGDQQQAAGGDQGGGAAAPAAAAPAPQADPQQIQLGMTPDQVEGALGKPEKIVNLGPKLLWVYKDMKITFLNGKVADVQ